MLTGKTEVVRRKKTCPSVILSNTRGISDGHTDNGTDFSPSSSVLYCQNHSTIALHSFSYHAPYILANTSVDMRKTSSPPPTSLSVRLVDESRSQPAAPIRYVERFFNTPSCLAQMALFQKLTLL